MSEIPIVESRNPRTIQALLPIILVLLIAAWLRVGGIAGTPVSTDEGWTTWAISRPFWSDVIERVATDRHPPLYFIALAYWSRIAGDSYFALRIPAAWIGVLTVAMVFRMGADTFGRTARAGRQDVSWYGMLLFAVLPLAVYYAQEIRHYGWFIASVTWSSLLFMRILRTPRVHLLILYAISVALMMYLLYFAVWIIGLHVVVGLLMWRGDYRRDWETTPRDKLKLVAAWAAALAMYAPWLVVIARYQWSILTSGISGAPGTFGSGIGDVFTLLGLLMGAGLALPLGLYIVGLWGSLVSDRTDVTLGLRFSNPAWLGELFVMLWGMGLFILLVIANNFTGVLSARTTAFLSPALMLVVGAGIVRLRTGVRWSLLAAFVAVSLVSPPLIQPRLDTISAAETLNAQYNAGDLIVLETGWDDNAFHYALKQAITDSDDPDIIRTLPWVNNRDEALPVVTEIRDKLETARRVWVVQWLQPSQVTPWLEEGNAGYTPVTQFDTPVGEQYRDRFDEVGGDDRVNMALYVRPEPDTRPHWDFSGVVSLVDWWHPIQYQRGQAHHVDTWWQLTDDPTDTDYAIGLYVFTLDGEQLMAETTVPLGHLAPTSEWERGAVMHHQHTLELPDDFPVGYYLLETVVFPLGEPDARLVVEGEGIDLWPIDMIEVTP